jgi:hypothetical protein
MRPEPSNYPTIQLVEGFPDADQNSLLQLVKRGISRFPGNEVLRLSGPQTPLGRPGAHALVRVAFRFRNGVGTGDMNLCKAQSLARVPLTDASPPPSRATARGSGPMWFAKNLAAWKCRRRGPTSSLVKWVQTVR